LAAPGASAFFFAWDIARAPRGDSLLLRLAGLLATHLVYTIIHRRAGRLKRSWGRGGDFVRSVLDRWVELGRMWESGRTTVVRGARARRGRPGVRPGWGGSKKRR